MSIETRISRLEQATTGDTPECARRIFDGLKATAVIVSDVTRKPVHSDDEIMKEAEALAEKFGHDYDRYLHGKHELPADVDAMLGALGC